MTFLQLIPPFHKNGSLLLVSVGPNRDLTMTFLQLIPPFHENGSLLLVFVDIGHQVIWHLKCTGGPCAKCC